MPPVKNRPPGAQPSNVHKLQPKSGTPLQSNAQRALWTFLMYSLVGPFLAGLTVAAAMILAAPFKLGALLPAALPPVGIAALQAFIWSAIPATLAAAVIAVYVLRRGAVPALAAAVVGVVACALATVAFPIDVPDLRPWVMGAGGLLALTLRQILIAGRILRV